MFMSFSCQPSSPSCRGFTLLEVMITLALLSVMMVSVSMLLRGSLDMRLSLSDKNTVISRLNIALESIKKDLEHAYLLSVNNDKELMKDGINYTFFRLSDFSGVTSLSFTSMVYPAYRTGEPQGELQRILYELKESTVYKGRNALYRAALSVGTQEKLETRLMVEGIRSLSFEMWTGSSWSSEWDTSKSTYREHLPPLVRVVISAYLQDPDPDELSSTAEEGLADIPGAHPGERRTLVYIPWAQRFELLKPPTIPSPDSTNP